MKNERLLYILILSEFVLAVSGLVTEMVFEPFLPGPIRAYLATNAAAAPKLTAALLTALWFAVLAGTVLAWLGLLNLLKAARPLYVASWVGYLLLIALRGPNVSSPVGYALDMLMALVGGMIVGIMYLSELRTKFRKFPRSAEEFLEHSA